MKTTLSLAGVLAMAPSALAGFDPTSASNLAVYWGQNSYGQAEGEFAQQTLGTYCETVEFDIIPLAFMNGITPPITNFASAGDRCTPFASNPNLLDCPEIAADIKTCQDAGKTILISLGGATYTQGGWPSTTEAEAAADLVWSTFGPVDDSGVDRPFGDGVVDGVDFDFEVFTSNIEAFGARLRTLMDASTAAGAGSFYLASAPQCVYPDAANGPALDGSVFFDFIMIQFYNNYCGVVNFVEGSETQNAFNFDVWQAWAEETSANPDVKILLGIPTNTGAGGGYTEGSQLQGAIEYSKQFASFGGVMGWDVSQLTPNTGFLEEILGYLG